MTKRTRTGFAGRLGLAGFGVAAALIAAGPAPAAGIDPGLLAMVPPGAKTLAGIQQGPSSPLGQTLLDLFKPDPATARLMAAAGFDPRRDLREILVSSEGNLASGSRGILLLGRGSFQPDKIAAATSTAATSSSYRGVTLLESKTSAQAAVAFPDAVTLLAGDPAAVKAAIDRRAAKITFSGALADRARQIASANDAWIASIAPQPGSVAVTEQLGPVGNLLQAAVQISAGVKFAPSVVTVSADLLARTPQDAQAMVDILKFGIQMLASSQAQGSSGGPNSAATLAQAARITADGSTLHAVLPVPEQFLQQILQPPSTGQPKKIAAR